MACAGRWPAPGFPAPRRVREKTARSRLLLVDERARGVLLDASRIAHDEEDAERKAEDQDDEAVDDALGERDAGEAGAMPVANGLTVEPITPMPAPSMITATPVRASKRSEMMAAMTSM